MCSGFKECSAVGKGLIGCVFPCTWSKDSAMEALVLISCSSARDLGSVMVLGVCLEGAQKLLGGVELLRGCCG